MNPILNTPGNPMLNIPVNPMLNNPGTQSGLSMIEVLVTLVILMVGLLGLAGLQTQALRSEMESYQRVQALILLQDMVGRINANRVNVAAYLENNIGTVDLGACNALAGQPRDKCEWSNALRGAGEKSGTTSVGAMLGGLGCVTLVDVTNNTYKISVAWQGMGQTFSQAGDNQCGIGQYGDDDARRRVVSLTIRIANLNAI